MTVNLKLRSLTLSPLGCVFTSICWSEDFSLVLFRTSLSGTLTKATTPTAADILDRVTESRSMGTRRSPAESFRTWRSERAARTDNRCLARRPWSEESKRVREFCARSRQVAVSCLRHWYLLYSPMLLHRQATPRTGRDPMPST